MFQSRNRDAFHFKQQNADLVRFSQFRFQSRNRDAFHFKSADHSLPSLVSHPFQSRNRDAFHFKWKRRCDSKRITSRFQSRNRDAFHFKPITDCVSVNRCQVSISESRCFSFQVRPVIGATKNTIEACFNLGIEMLFISRLDMTITELIAFLVSISESRCFSFQAASVAQTNANKDMFQSRNRDAFHFKES